MIRISKVILLLSVAVLTFIISACNTPIAPEVTEEILITEPTETEEPALTMTATHTLTPTAEPTQEEVVPGLTQDKMNILGSQLEFMMGETSINEISSLPKEVTFEFSSSGIFENLDLTNTSTGEVIGKITTLTAISRDKDQNPIVVRIALQAELYSDKGVNSFPLVYQILGPSLGEDRDYEKLASLEEWKEMMLEGSEWTFVVSKENPSEIFTGSTLFSSLEYGIAVSSFISSGGVVSPEDLVLVPTGAIYR